MRTLWKRTGPALLLVGAIGALLWLGPRVDVGALLGWLDGAPPWLLGMVLLGAPLTGFPLSVLLVMLGTLLTLPAAVGWLLIVLITHHLLMWRLACSPWSRRVQAVLEGRRLLPPSGARHGVGNDLLLILAATWVPGLPYIFKVGLTALAGIRFRTYLVAGVGSQAVAAAPYLVFGRLAQDAALGAIGIAVVALAGLLWLLKRLAGRLLTPARPGDPPSPDLENRHADRDVHEHLPSRGRRNRALDRHHRSTHASGGSRGMRRGT